MYEQNRNRMVDRLRAAGYVTSEAVLEALRRVPRHEFVPLGIMDRAYDDTPLPIGQGQTISAPHMVGMMLEILDIRPGMRVLEVGTGSGYHAAVTAELVRPGGKVFTIERIEELARRAEAILQRLGYGDTVEVLVDDGTKGLPQYAPYDRIFVAAAGPRVPEPLKQQLAEGGMLMVPVGGKAFQDLVVVTNRHGELVEQSMGSVVFVPLIGEHGHQEP